MFFQKLINLKNENLNKKIFYFVTKNLKNTIFNFLGYEFYCEIYLKNNYQNIFFYKKKNQLEILISYIDLKTEKKIKKEIIKYLISNPIKIILLLKNIKYFFKFSKNPNNFIQLLHLIINKSIMTKANKIYRNNQINELHKKFIRNKYKGIYATFDNENIAAKKYYEKNNYILYNKNLFFSFVKKKIY
jgi:hypothetical protein